MFLHVCIITTVIVTGIWLIYYFSLPCFCHPGSGVDTGSVLGIVFVAFLLGISLMGALWCIYSHTGNHTGQFVKSILDQRPKY